MGEGKARDRALPNLWFLVTETDEKGTFVLYAGRVGQASC